MNSDVSNEIRNHLIDFTRSRSNEKINKKLVREIGPCPIYKFDCPDTNGVALSDLKSEVHDLIGKDGRLKLPADSFIINHGFTRGESSGMYLAEWVREVKQDEMPPESVVLAERFPKLKNEQCLLICMLWFMGPVAMVWQLMGMTSELASAVNSDSKALFTGTMQVRRLNGMWEFNPDSVHALQEIGTEAWLDLLLFIRAYQNEELVSS